MHGNDDKTAYRESSPVTAWLVLLADCVLSQHWTEPVEQDWLGEGAGVVLGAGAGAGVATARMARDIATATLKNIVDREEWECAVQIGGAVRAEEIFSCYESCLYTIQSRYA